MAGINRTTLYVGPGHLLYGAGLTSKLYCTKISVALKTTWLDIMPGGFGRIDRRKHDEVITISISALGAFNAGLAALLWPYGATAMGTSIFGATDTAWGIQTLGGQKFTFHNAAVTRMPSIRIGAGQMIYSDFELTAIIKNATDRTNAAALYTLAANAWAGQPAKADYVMLPAAATWALGSPETIVAKKGWQVDFDLALDWQVSEDFGTFDALFRHMEVRARCLPMGYAESRWAELKIQDSGNGIGTNARVQADLTIAQANPGATIVLKNAAFDNQAMEFADNQDRMGEVVWIATRDISAGYGTLFSIGVTPA